MRYRVWGIGYGSYTLLSVRESFVDLSRPRGGHDFPRRRDREFERTPGASLVRIRHGCGEGNLDAGSRHDARGDPRRAFRPASGEEGDEDGGFTHRTQGVEGGSEERAREATEDFCEQKEPKAILGGRFGDI